MAASVEVRFAGPEDLVRIGGFLQELGGPYFNQNRFPGKSAHDYYHWKYFGNRLGKAVVGIAIAGERIVSTVAATVKPVQLKGRRLIGYELGDFLTATDFRQRGLFSQLVNMVCSETEARGASLVYVQPNEISFPLLMKLGFAEPLQIQQRHYAVPSSVLARRLHVPAGLISWTGIDDLMGRLAAPRGSDESVRVELISRFDEETDRIWQQAGKDYELLLARENEFLNWRYVDSPTPFQIWLARRKEEPVGFLVGDEAGVFLQGRQILLQLGAKFRVPSAATVVTMVSTITAPDPPEAAQTCRPYRRATASFHAPGARCPGRRRRSEGLWPASDRRAGSDRARRSRTRWPPTRGGTARRQPDARDARRP